MEFELQGHEYIPLNQLLKALDLVDSGGEAKVRIQAGEVLVNDAVETQIRKKLRVGDRVKLDEETVLIR